MHVKWPVNLILFDLSILVTADEEQNYETTPFEVFSGLLLFPLPCFHKISEALCIKCPQIHVTSSLKARHKFHIYKPTKQQEKKANY
jgi:hypothetical protein